MTLSDSIVLLVLTAVLIGLLIPTVKEVIDRRSLLKQQESEDRRRREDKKHEADLARQRRLIESQAQLLDNLAGMLWKLWKMLLRIVHYRTLQKDMDKHDAAYRIYEDEFWDLIGDIRAEISRARLLAPEEIYTRLTILFRHFSEELDITLNSLRNQDAYLDPDSKDGLDKDWDTFRIVIYEDFGKEIDATLTALAKELRLASSAYSRIESPSSTVVETTGT
jgi:hypothetical protein